MPDQYTLSAFQRLELAPPHRKPVKAEIDLVSSHHPWTPLPQLVPWDQVGDGSVYDGMPAQGESPESVFRTQTKVRAAYGQSIEYSLNSLISFVQTYPDPNLVVVMLGDHQPHTYVTGPHPGHDVPITVIAHDPKVLDADRRAGTGRTACAPPRTRRCGGWTPSATSSSRRTDPDAVRPDRPADESAAPDRSDGAGRHRTDPGDTRRPR